MADGIEYGLFRLKENREAGRPDLSDRRHAAHHRPERRLQGGTQSNAARLIQSYMLSAECSSSSSTKVDCGRPTS